MSTTQGKTFTHHWKQFYQTHQPKYIHEGTLQEGFAQRASKKADASTPQVFEGQDALHELMNEFDTTFTSYQDAVKTLAELEEEYNTVLMRNNELPGGIEPYLGKVVVDPHGVHYYITKYGHKRKYTTQAWTTKNIDCVKDNDTVPQISLATLELALDGPDMNVNEPCGKEGTVVRDGSTANYMWVDVRGVGHVFTPNTADYTNAVRAGRCTDAYSVLGTDLFHAIPRGPSMSDTDVCASVIIDPTKKEKVIHQKQQVALKLDTLIKIVDSIQSHDEELNNAFQERRTELEVAVRNLRKEASHEKSTQENNRSLQEKWNTLLIQERMEYYQYLGFAAIGVVVTGAMLHQLFSRSSA